MNTNPKKEVVLVASGDLRLSANQSCWQAQQDMEQLLAKARICFPPGYTQTNQIVHFQGESKVFINNIRLFVLNSIFSKRRLSPKDLNVNSC